MRTGIHLLATLLLVASAHAQSGDDPFRFVRWPISDLANVPVAIRGENLALTAGAGLGLVALSMLDRSVTTRFRGDRNDYKVRIAEEFGNVRTVRPATVAIFAGALLAGDTRLQDAAFTSLESIIMANLITDLLKTVVGRARPWQQEGHSSFEPFSGRSSFPSGHATTAFAALTPFAAYYGSGVAAGLYLVATAAAASRVATQVHWLSDVVGGAAIGFLTAHVLTRRHRGLGKISLTPVITASGTGLRLRF